MSLDWIGAALIGLNAYMVGKKNKWGWLVSVAGCLLFMYVGFKNHLYGMIALNTFIAIISIINFIKWHKDDKQLQITKASNPV